MIDTYRMRCTRTQLIEPVVHCAPIDHECKVPWYRWNFGSTVHCNIARFCQSWTSWQLMRLKNRLRSGKQRTMSKESRWIHAKSKLPVRRKNNYRIWRCTSTPLRRKHGTQTSWPQVDRYQQRKRKPHVTVRVWCVRRCALKESNRSSRQQFVGNSASPDQCCVSGRCVSS